MIKNSVYGIYFARCMNIFNSLLLQLVKYDVHTTRKINSIHAIFYHILSFYRANNSASAVCVTYVSPSVTSVNYVDMMAERFMIVSETDSGLIV